MERLDVLEIAVIDSIDRVLTVNPFAGVCNLPGRATSDNLFGMIKLVCAFVNRLAPILTIEFN